MPKRHTFLNLSAGFASVAVAVTLVVLKLWAVVQTGSLSIAASMADNMLDVLVSVGALAAIAYAARPPDDDHRFGHSSAEDLAALLQSALVLVSAAIIGVLSVLRLASNAPAAVRAEGDGIAVMLVSVVLTVLLVAWQRHVVRITGSRVIAADSVHFVGDMLPTLGVLIALGSAIWWGETRIDSVVALLAALWLAYGGLKIGRGAWDALMDHSAPPEMLQKIHAVADDWPGIHAFHDLKTRTAGSRVFVSLHVELDGRLSLNEAHAIADALEHRLLEVLGDSEVIIHLDPIGPGSGRTARGKAEPMPGGT